MGKLIKGLTVVLIFICSAYRVKAEVVIEIKIPEEIKICECGCGCKGEKTDPQNVAIQPPNPRNTHKEDIEDAEALQRIGVAEAGNTDVYTMAYVMQTVLNRVESDQFPNTVVDVIKQKGQFATYPDKYNNSKPNELSKAALDLLPELNNQNQLYFENTVAGSWQSTNLQWLFDYNVLSFYK